MIGEEIFEMNLFFPGNPFCIIFIPGECQSKLFLSLEKSLRIFFLDFLRPHPKIINGRPLILKISFYF